MSEEYERKRDRDRDGPKKEDPRVDGLVTVGWVTLAMLGLSIPLGATVGGWMAGLIPLAVILGSGVMAARIWSSGEKTVHQKENQALVERIDQLESRLANLEMIDSVEQHFAARHRAGEGNPASPSPTRNQDTPAPTTMGPSAESISD